MNNKFQITSSMVILILFYGCTSKPLFIKLQDKNYYDKVQSIGIYLNPSRYEEYDRILFNALSLRCITAGYDVINMSQSPDKSNPFDKSYAIKGNHQKQIRTIQAYITENKIDVSNINVVYVVTPKWKRFPRYFLNKKSGGFYEAECEALTLSLTTLAASTVEIIASSTISDSTEMYLDDQTASRFKKGENVTDFRYYPTPIYVLIQKCIDLALEERHPTPKLEYTLRVKYQFPVTFYVSEKYRELFHDNWKVHLEHRLLYASDIFAKQFNVIFNIQEFKEWNTYGEKSPERLLENLMRLTSNVKDQFIIGVTFDEALSKDWIDYHKLGLSAGFGNHLVIKDVPSFEEVMAWDAIQEALVIVHELGHSFGAMHIHDPTSVMYPNAGGMNYQFNAFNEKVIQLTIPQKLNPISRETYYSNLNNLIYLFKTSKQKNIEFIPMISGILSKDYLIYAGMEKEIVNQDNFQLPDSSILHAVNGYSYYEKADWKNALKEFEAALQLNSELPEIYAYCAKIYEKLEDKKMSEYYRKSAEEMGFGIISDFQP